MSHSEEPHRIPGGPGDAFTVTPSDFPERLTAWMESSYPVRVLSVDAPPATGGEMTITIRLTPNVAAFEALPDDLELTAEQIAALRASADRGTGT